MPIVGFGIQPLGITASGIGTPVGLPLPGAGYEFVSDLVANRGLNLSTNDYDVNDSADGAPHAEITAMEQQVILALSTPEGQLPQDLLFGDATLNLDKIPDSLVSTVIGRTQTALFALTSAGQVSIDAVDVVRAGSNGIVRTVTWTDLTTGEQTSTTA